MFGDSFDLYTNPADATAGYWDSGNIGFVLVSGRFSGSRAAQQPNNFGSGQKLVKASGQNDAVHHLTVAIAYWVALSGTATTTYFQLLDGATVQCCIVLRSDGAITLTNGNLGTVQATYTGAFIQNVWTAFEFEVVIHNTAGSFTVRKNGSPTNSFQATSLNTRASANNYANGISYSTNGNNTSDCAIDDLLWRSDPTSVPWVGDIRCYTRMPSGDVSKLWTPNSGTTNYTRVNEAQQDGITSYVSDSNVNDADLYSTASAGSPATTVCVTTRGFAEKSDAGARSAAVQLKSGSTTVTSTSTALGTSWGWLWRTDINDPATGSAWTASGVNNATIGPIVTA